MYASVNWARVGVSRSALMYASVNWAWVGVGRPVLMYASVNCAMKARGWPRICTISNWMPYVYTPLYELLDQLLHSYLTHSTSMSYLCTFSQLKYLSLDLPPSQPLEMHETVAECMIFANHWVAKKIHEAFPTSALLRHHPPPSQDKFGALLECARAKGFTVATGSNKSLAESLDLCVDPHDANINKVGVAN